MTRSIRWTLVLAVAGLWAAAPARAAEPGQSEPEKAEAAQRFDRGLALFDEGDNAGALAEFNRAYALIPNPVVRYNIGLVYAAMGRPVDAADALGAVVDSAELSPEQREHAKRTLDDQQARIGRVWVTTAPEGARLDVDKVEVGKTPLTAPLRVAEGTHIIGAVAEGYAHGYKEVMVAGNAEAALHFDLVLAQSKRPANLTVRSRIPEATLLVDGKPSGETPLSSSLALAAGRHSVELRRPGYTPVSLNVDLGEGATSELSLDLVVDPGALAAEGADLALALDGSSAEVFVDAEHLGPYSHPLRLPKGLHHLRLESAGYLPYEQDVRLEPGRSNQLHPRLSPTAATRQAHEDNLRLHRTWGWVGVIGGAAIAGGGAVWLLVNAPSKRNAQSDYDAAVADATNHTGICDTFNGGSATDCNARLDSTQSALDRAKSKDLVGFVALGVGGAAIATGVVLLLTGDSATRFEAAPSARARRPARRWALLPGPGDAGLGVCGVF